MAKFEVSVQFTVDRTITVYARDEEAAMERAQEIVEDWNNVVRVEPYGADEVDE